jgi:hypothetical protein
VGHRLAAKHLADGDRQFDRLVVDPVQEPAGQQTLDRAVGLSARCRVLAAPARAGGGELVQQRALGGCRLGESGNHLRFGERVRDLGGAPDRPRQCICGGRNQV